MTTPIGSVIMTLAEIENAILEEIAVADARYGAFTSTHEGLGVLIEELDELKTAIHDNDLPGAQVEATQIAAVAWRLAGSLVSSETCDRSHP